MTRFLLPLLFLGGAVALFMLFTNPRYQAVQVLQSEASVYDDALNKSQELKRKRDELNARRNTFAATDVQKLEKILPDNVDNIRLVIDINNVAARHGLTLSDVTLGSLQGGAEGRSATAVGASEGRVGSVELGFTLTASYESMVGFLIDLEHSLRLIDVEQLGFAVEDQGGSNSEYTFKIRTYWLH